MDNPLISPNFGLVVWQVVILLILIFLLKKFAWKPILDAVKARETSIEEALKSAESAKAEMTQLQAQNEELLKEAREERDAMLKEAREIKENMITEAKGTAKLEADKILSKAQEAIKAEKAAALAELKGQVAALSLEIAEKIVKQDLSNNDKQKALADSLAEDINLN